TTSPPAVATALSSSTNINGALLTAAPGNSVVAFNSADSGNIGGAVSFTQPATSTRVVIADLAPSTSYSVSPAPSGSNFIVTVQAGSGFTTSSNGTLYVVIAANGTVSAGN